MTVVGDIGGTFDVTDGIVNCLDVSVDVLAARVLRRDKNEGITTVHVAWVIKDLCHLSDFAYRKGSDSEIEGSTPMPNREQNNELSARCCERRGYKALMAGTWSPDS